MTGAGSGLGKAVAVAAAKEGAAVVLADINEDAMNKLSGDQRERAEGSLQPGECVQSGKYWTDAYKGSRHFWTGGRSGEIVRVFFPAFRF